MNTFNKLYNLILQSIITQNKADRKRMIDASDYTENDKNWLIDWLDYIAKDSDKMSTFICRYFCDHTLQKFDDPRIDQVKEILEKNSSVDTQGWKGTLDQFIDKYMYTLEELEQKRKYSAFDNIPELSDKEVLQNGIVTYEVEDSEAGMNTVRKIIDYQRGKKANPWCLAARSPSGDMKEALIMWNHYNKYPKRIAFQNGKLLAFCASARQKTWWDLNDQIMSFEGLLRDFDGNMIQTKDVHMYSTYQKEKVALNNFKKLLTYNEQTGKYDCKTSLRLFKTITRDDGTDEDVPVSRLLIKKGRLVIPFGKINGSFDCSCLNLKTLQNCPEIVVGQFSCQWNFISSLEGGPKKVGGDYVAWNNYNLKSLKGKPQYLGGKMFAKIHTTQDPVVKGYKEYDDFWKDNEERS